LGGGGGGIDIDRARHTECRIAGIEVELREALVLGEAKLQLTLSDVLLDGLQLGPLLEGGLHRLLEVDRLDAVVDGVVGGIEEQHGPGADPVAQDRGDQLVLGVAVVVLGHDQVELTVRDTRFGLHDVDLGDDAHFVLRLGLIQQGHVALEALLGDALLLFVGDQLPIDLDDVADGVHHRGREGLELPLVGEAARLDLRPGLIPDQALHERNAAREGQAGVLLRIEGKDEGRRSGIGLRLRAIEHDLGRCTDVGNEGLESDIALYSLLSDVEDARSGWGGHVLAVPDLAAEVHVVGPPGPLRVQL
jgi:hypothetical protein